jgi:hypothetical protein
MAINTPEPILQIHAKGSSKVLPNEPFCHSAKDGDKMLRESAVGRSESETGPIGSAVSYLDLSNNVGTVQTFLSALLP